MTHGQRENGYYRNFISGCVTKECKVLKETYMCIVKTFDGRVAELVYAADLDNLSAMARNPIVESSKIGKNP